MTQDLSRDPAAPKPLLRRLVERFALVAFGLYHLPLLLNDYPSLGGGGIADDGLAVRWGHVFTAPGLWLARRMFGITGPMTEGAQGDNGDVAEEWARLILCVGLGAVAAALWTVADRRQPRAPWVEGALRVMLRYAIALGLMSYAVAKLVPMQFPPLRPFDYELRVGELTPMRVLWDFMRYSKPYSVFAGMSECLAVMLLCARRTATLGALTTVAVMTNVALMNWAYDVEVKLYATMLLVSAGALVLCDARRLVAFFVENRAVAAASQPTLFEGRIPTAVRWALKVALVGSVTVSSFVVFARLAASRPVATGGVNGAWGITSFTAGARADDGKAMISWRRLIVDPEVLALRLDDDALVRCRRTPVAADAALLAFQCRDGRKGELRATAVGDTLRVEGTFDGAAVTAAGRRLDESDYPLMKGGLQIIQDRE